MITNTELEYKGDLYPSKIVSFKQDVDSVYFYTENNVILKLTVLRDSLIRFRYTTKGYFSNDFSYAIDFLSCIVLKAESKAFSSAAPRFNMPMKQKQRQ